ncbi:hypothetical protein PRBEI_2000622500 [Prionailurus iriomotensis]
MSISHLLWQKLFHHFRTPSFERHIEENLELWAFCIGRLASWRNKHWLLPLTP